MTCWRRDAGRLQRLRGGRTRVRDGIRAGKLWGFIRHARISKDQASQFWDQLTELVDEFDRMPRSGETMYGFAIGIFPTDHPTLPTAE
jgi:hypothetical protein